MKDKRPAWNIGDHEIPGTGGLRSMHVDPSAVTPEEAMKNPVARKVLEIGVLNQILNEINDINAAAWYADRFDRTKYFERFKQEGRAPFIKYSTKEKLTDALCNVYRWYVESLGIEGILGFKDTIFNLEVVYDFANKQPTRVTAAIYPASEQDNAKKAITNIPALIMPRNRFYHPNLNLERVLKLGDYEDERKESEAVVLRGDILYGRNGKDMYKVWEELIKKAANSEEFIPSVFYLRVNSSFKHHEK